MANIKNKEKFVSGKAVKIDILTLMEDCTDGGVSQAENAKQKITGYFYPS